jgi:cephalosporin hydroxylase
MGAMEARPVRDEARFFASTPEDEELVRRFFMFWYAQGAQTFQNMHWLGTKAIKPPFDFWVYQEILYETRPDVVVETGTFRGGSAHFMASIFDLLGHGRITTIDIEKHEGLPQHPRITYLNGDSIAPEIVSRVKESIDANERVMVILDSAHNGKHVLEEMRAYGPLVKAGQYMIVEDTHINLHVPQPPPDRPYPRPGPLQAVWDYLDETDRFEIDRSREKFFLTFNPSGYLRCIRD